jgi:hypothetical protein
MHACTRGAQAASTEDEQAQAAEAAERESQILQLQASMMDTTVMLEQREAEVGAGVGRGMARVGACPSG